MSWEGKRWKCHFLESFSSLQRGRHRFDFDRSEGDDDVKGKKGSC